MKKFLLATASFISLLCSQAIAQTDLSYYLPDKVTYDPKIPTPKSIIGHEVGEYHVSHDKLVNYMHALDNASDRVTLEVTGHTHEGRPLLLLTITSPQNHQNLEQIRLQHIQLADPGKSSSLNVSTMPAVFYLGCSIHGNEPSGSNAGLLLAYHLAAAQGPEIEATLKNTIILFDPSFNPDGLHRFSTWANSRKGKVLATDPYDMEHNESWPGGRTNHYWFDLNRDWLVAQQPESQARIKKFHQWKPNVLTDHHEMGTNSTFFFQPGVPSRKHPLTPKKNHELTMKIGEFHAKALDGIGSLYFTQEGYDDFYYGKGSTFPDVQGAIGILFEQASSRGHAQESVNGILNFSFTIRNQFITGLSTLAAVNTLREELLNYQRQFFKDAVAEASKDPVKAIIFGSSKDKARTYHLAEIVARQDIAIYKPASSQKINGKEFNAESSYIVPLNQAQYRLIKGMFEKRTQFEDSLFYDISSWTLTLASGLDYEELKATPALGEKVTTLQRPEGKRINGKSTYAYAFDPYAYYTPRAIYKLLQHGIRIKVSTALFHHQGKQFDRGSVIIPLEGQEKSVDLIEFVLDNIAKNDGIDVYAVNTGLDYQGSSLGSNSFMTLKKPQIAMLVDAGVVANDAGEIWHLLDTRYDIPVTKIPTTLFNTANLNKYTTIIFPPGSYHVITDHAKEKLRQWIQNGGVAIGFENALNWFNTNGFGKFEMKKKEEQKNTNPRPYEFINAYEGAQETSGAIFEATADLTHPLLFGYSGKTMPIFKSNNLCLEVSKNPYANPITFTASPLISGYISRQNYDLVKNASVVGVSSIGKGRVIGFTDNMAFRAFWFGSNKMLMNAIFYGSFINERSSR